MAITNLTNTTWNIPAGWTATAGYGIFSISFKLNDEVDCTGLDVGYNGFLDNPNIADFIYVAAQHGGGTSLTPSNSFTIEILGGTDVSNTKLISWLEANGTQIIEELPSSKETYFSIMSELAQTIAEKTGVELPLSIDEMIDALDNSSSDSNVSGYNVTLNRGSYAGFTDYITITYADGVVETYKKYNETYLGITLSNVVKVQIYSKAGVELYSSTGSFTNTNGYTTTELSFDITEDSTTTITVDI